MTEKNYNQQQQTVKTMQKQQTAAETKVEAAPIKKEETKLEEKKTEEKKETKKPEKKLPKKDYAIVRGISLPISTKTSAAICRFIKGKTIEKAIMDLEEVTRFKRVIPMTGEIPHKKGKGVMSGRYPLKAISYFLRMLRTLNANAAVNGLEESVIVEAVPNRASQPYGRFGAVRRKRTHVEIKVMEKKENKPKGKGEKK